MRRIAYVLVAVVFIVLIIAGNHYTKSQAYGEEWWNGSWHYRVKLTVNTTEYNRTDWPVEYQANFTALMEELNATGIFDQNSARIIEVNDSGGILHELPSQFDAAGDFNSSTNAAGTLTFILNGTTASYTERWFYLYFDTQNASKEYKGYDRIINKTWDGDEFRIYFNNESGTDYYGFFTFDTNRSQNTSGLYQYFLKDTYLINYPDENEKTREYIQTTDDEYNYTYDLRGNASISEGAARIRVYQEGYETYWNQADNRTNMTYLKKTYYFYPNKTWFVIEHEIININDSSVTRGSYAGIPGFDTLGAYGAGYKVQYNYSMDPGSVVRGAPSLGTRRVSYTNLWENGTTNFRADNYTTDSTPNYDRIGINLSMTSIGSGGAIKDRSVMVFYDSQTSPDLDTDTRDRLMNNVNITQDASEMWVVALEPEPDHDIYNRNESAMLGANMTLDGWGLADRVNATLDMGTPGASGDDVTIELLDDGNYPDQAAGDDYFTAYYNFSDSETTGYWNMTMRAYDSDGAFLNESYYTFNVTDEFNVSISIWNVTGLIRVENATVNVTNLRQDIYIPGATLNCTTAGDPVPQGNITDHGDGTYTVEFQTPFDYGLYPLNCSAEKDGSWGFNVENYTVEAPETNMTITPQPSLFNAYNVTFYDNESFNLQVTVENIGNSTAYDANITLALPGDLTSNSTFEECGMILISLSCVRSFNITILNNSVAKDYIINMTLNWTNRIATQDSNTSSATVTVHENPILDVLEENVTGILPPGASSQTIETLLAMSMGNNDTLNITFNPVGLDNFTIEFSPQNITVLGPGEEQPVQVMVSVPSGQFPGIYDGWINITSDNGGYELLNATIIVTGTNLTINATPDNYTALNVTAFSNESLEFTVNVTNTGNTTASNSYINITLPGNWYVNATNHSCGNMTKGETCIAYFFVNITELTYAGNYTINATINWEDIGISWKSMNDTINVAVASNITLEVLEDGFERVMEHGTSIVIGNMTVRSTGNDDAINVTFNVSQELENFTIEFNQTIPFSMTPGDFRTVRINATIPPGFAPGDYNGTINVSSDNDGYKTLYVNMSVPENGSWTVNTTYCEHAQSPETGVACDVLINNIGNIQLNFSVYPAAGANHTTPSWSSYNLSKQNSTILTINYDMGGEAGSGYFLTNYTLNTTEAAADPVNVTLEIVLNPFVNPLVEIGITPAIQIQAGSVTMVVNITSQSGADLDVRRVTVQRPGGTNDTLDLGFGHQVFWYGCEFIIEDPGDMLCYQITYPGSFSGNSSQKGNYTVFAFANDTYDVNTTNTSMFQIYTRYMVDLYMQDTAQGSWESINYRARDYVGEPLPGASVNLSVRDPENRTMYMLSGEEYVTDSQGWVSDNIFVIPAHATIGEYTIYSNGTYYDSNVSLWVSNETTATFNVTEDQELIAKVGIPSPSYVDKMMTVSVIVLMDFNTPVDPDSINLTIYYTEGYNLDPWRQLGMGDLNKTGTGFYKYSEVLSSVLTGSYLAMLKVTLGDGETYDIQPFRISSGGPYDVFLDLAQSEVIVGSPLGFDVTIWNKGEIDHQDVVTDYWVYGNGQSWDSSSFSTNILGGENKTFPRSVFIYSNQPPGFYTLNVEVLYDPNQPPATANATFLVKAKEEEEEEEEEGGGGGGGAPPAAPGGPAAGTINITKAPDQVGAMIGLPKFFNVNVQAAGGSVQNVQLGFENVPDGWFITDPVNITYLAGGDSAIFVVQLTVPRGESGERNVTIVANATGSTDRRDMVLRIFTSRKDLINFELNRLRAKLSELRDLAEEAKNAGFDTSRVDDLLDDAEGEIKLAEGYLREELYDAALESVHSAWKLLDDAEELLDKMFASFAIPWWIFLIIIFALIIVVLLFFYRKISNNLSILLRGRLAETRRVAGAVKGAGSDIGKLREEKAKIVRMLTLLESQYTQGIISGEAYESLRKRSRERLTEIDNKIREAIRG